MPLMRGELTIRPFRGEAQHIFETHDTLDTVSDTRFHHYSPVRPASPLVRGVPLLATCNSRRLGCQIRPMRSCRLTHGAFVRKQTHLSQPHLIRDRHSIDLRHSIRGPRLCEAHAVEACNGTIRKLNRQCVTRWGLKTVEEK